MGLMRPEAPKTRQGGCLTPLSGVEKMRKEGFTLVELILVVSILGILGALVLPVYQGHASEAKVSSSKSNLHAIRAQIELYKMQHNGTLPGYERGAVTTETSLLLQFITTTDIDGVSSLSKTTYAAYPYGPYLLKVPANPFNGKSNIAYSTAFATDVGVKDSGWLYNRTTGQIVLNYPGNDADGMAYIDY
jgi:prepilin-type N-terminal cleavage/methylation domain-containing protein